MNKYKEAIDVMARYISDCKVGIKRYADREIDTAMAKIVELETHCNELEHELEVSKEEYNADQKYIEDFDTRQIVIDEQNEEIEYLYKYIEQLETKNKILNKALNDSCKDIEELTGSCPYDIFNHYCFCDNCKDSYIKCWRKFFIDKAKEGK